jgi:hypothetical protein
MEIQSIITWCERLSNNIEIAGLPTHPVVDHGGPDPACIELRHATAVVWVRKQMTALAAVRPKREAALWE